MENSKQKRILVITNMYPNKINKSFGIFVKNHVEALRKRDYHVDVEAVSDHRMGKLFVIKKYLIWAMKILISLVTKGKRYDTVHAHYVFPSGLFGLWFKKLFGTKLIVTAHGGDIDKMAKKNSFFYNQSKKILHQADQIVAVGVKLKSDIVENFGIPEDKVIIINMGVNRKIFRPLDKQETKRKLDLSEQSFHLLLVGNMIKAKGVDELIKAFKNLKERYPFIELHLIGTAKEPLFLNRLKQETVDENIQDVHFHTSMPQPDIALWMSASDVFVLPSYTEGFGLVALEAMSCHTPVVGSDVGGLSYLLRDGSGILVESQNIESLQDGIEKVIKDKDLRENLIQLGEAKAKENDEEEQLDKLIEVYGMIGARQEL